MPASVAIVLVRGQVAPHSRPREIDTHTRAVILRPALSVQQLLVWPPTSTPNAAIRTAPIPPTMSRNTTTVDGRSLLALVQPRPSVWQQSTTTTVIAQDLGLPPATLDTGTIAESVTLQSGGAASPPWRWRGGTRLGLVPEHVPTLALALAAVLARSAMLLSELVQSARPSGRPTTLDGVVLAPAPGPDLAFSGVPAHDPNPSIGHHPVARLWPKLPPPRWQVH